MRVSSLLDAHAPWVPGAAGPPEIYEPAATGPYRRTGIRGPRPAVFDNNFHLVPPRDIRALPRRFPGNPAPSRLRCSRIYFGRNNEKFFETPRGGNDAPPPLVSPPSSSPPRPLCVRLNCYIVSESRQDGHLPCSRNILRCSGREGSRFTTTKKSPCIRPLINARPVSAELRRRLDKGAGELFDEAVY